LKYNDEEEIETPPQIGEEEIVNPKDQEKDVEIFHSIDQNTKCEIPIHALENVLVPRNLKIVQYIKKKKFIVLVDSDITYNFIYKILVEHLNSFVYSITNFQVMVVDGGSIDYGENFHNQ